MQKCLPRNSATFAVIRDPALGNTNSRARSGLVTPKGPLKLISKSSAGSVPKIGCLGDCRALA
jgi:hypothetical protein